MKKEDVDKFRKELNDDIDKIIEDDEQKEKLDDIFKLIQGCLIMICALFYCVGFLACLIKLTMRVINSIIKSAI